MKTTFDVVKI
jgi:hypothetical protein